MNYFFSFFAFLMAACFGSFFKLVVDRYGTNESVVFSPSYCRNCKNKLKWWQNIPIFSYLFLRGKCFYCKSMIDTNCFFAEVVTGILVLLLFIFTYNKNTNIIGIISLETFLLILILLSFFDLKHRIVPHTITYLAIVFIIFMQFIFKQSVLSSFANLGIAFIFMDFLYFFATLIKKYQFDITNIVIPLLGWTIYFYFFNNLYFLFILIALYFILINLKFPLKVFILFWLLTFLIFIFQIYKIVFIDFDFDKLILFFSGIGSIYFCLEVLFYFALLLFRSKFSNIPQEEENKRITIGGGDITLFALISVFLTYKIAFLVLFVASLLALISHLLLKAFSTKVGSQYVPFVPYLSFACFIIILINGR